MAFDAGTGNTFFDGSITNNTDEPIWWKPSGGDWRPLPPGETTPEGVDADGWAPPNHKKGDQINKVNDLQHGKVTKDASGKFVDNIGNKKKEKEFGPPPPDYHPKEWKEKQKCKEEEKK